jgi:dolichol-phosphate mannosyltransferase
MAIAGAVRNLLAGSGTQTLWVRGIRFGLVGASGYVVNVAVYSTELRAGIDYRLAATASFLVAASSNYFLNRTWTFGTSGRVRIEAPRFLAVSAAALSANILVLTILVHGGLPKLEAQALAIVVIAPLSFLANKWWAFRA